MEVMGKWITDKTIELVGFEDDILIGTIINMLQEGDGGKKIQLYLTGFMEKGSAPFMVELWGLLVDAMSSPSWNPLPVH